MPKPSKPDLGPCAGNVYDDLRTHPCPYRASVQGKDGKAYCKTHDPERIAARNAKQREKWRREWAVGDAAGVRDDAANAVMQALGPAIPTLRQFTTDHREIRILVERHDDLLRAELLVHERKLEAAKG